VPHVSSGSALNNDERKRMPHRDEEAVPGDWRIMVRDLDGGPFGMAAMQRLYAEAIGCAASIRR
jgi:hypothetical protein